jgi:hypothetical protein
MFASTYESIKNFSFSGLFTTNAYTPEGIHANPSALVDALENAFKAKFEQAPNMDRLRTIAPRQAYAGGENVFVYAYKRAQVHIGIAYDELMQALKDAWGIGTIVILSLPATISDNFTRIVMGFAVPLNYAYYTAKHWNTDVGAFAAKITAQMHGTKLAMKKYNRFTANNGTDHKVLHIKQIVLSSGAVLTAQLDSTGTVTLFHADGDGDHVLVRWHVAAEKVNVGTNGWNEEEFNSAFVKVVATQHPQYVEEMANAALNAQPLTKESMIKGFAEKNKATKREAKEDVKSEEAAPAAQPAAAAPTDATPEQPQDVKSESTPAHPVSEVVDSEGTADVTAQQAAQESAERLNAAAAATDIDVTFEAKDGEVHATVDMGELKGTPISARNNKPCGDQNAIRIVRKVIGKTAVHFKDELAAAEVAQPVETIAFIEETNTLRVKSAYHYYEIVCVDGGSQKPVFRLVSTNLKALGEAIDFDFGQHTAEYCVTNAALIHKLLGNGNTLMPVVFATKS